MSTDNEKWGRLKYLAQKATPGPWWVDSHGHRVSTEDGMQTVFIADDRMGPATRHPETGNLSHWPNDWDASYIVNASPDKILELIAALSAVTAERDRLDAECVALAAGACDGVAGDEYGHTYCRYRKERDQLRAEVEASRLLLEQCNEVIAEDGGVYIELRAFLAGTMPASDVIALLRDAALAAKEASDEPS